MEQVYCKPMTAVNVIPAWGRNPAVPHVTSIDLVRSWCCRVDVASVGGTDPPAAQLVVATSNDGLVHKFVRVTTGISFSVRTGSDWISSQRRPGTRWSR